MYGADGVPPGIDVTKGYALFVAFAEDGLDDGDNDYHCDIEVWGSKGTLTSGRILTAPVGCVPTYTVKQNQEYTNYNFSEDDAFLKSILKFADCCIKEDVRKENYTILLHQSKLVDEFRTLAKM